jgi:hypothetical protein
VRPRKRRDRHRHLQRRTIADNQFLRNLVGIAFIQDAVGANATGGLARNTFVSNGLHVIDTIGGAIHTSAGDNKTAGPELYLTPPYQTGSF